MLHVERRGVGPPLVLLHGFTGSSATWWPIGERLARDFTTIAVDLPGHGRSAPLRAAPEDALGALVSELVGVLDALSIERPAWLGYSMGGRVALAFALRHPERVGHLVLESASPGIADRAERARRTEADDALAATIEREDVERFVERWMAQPLFASQNALGAETLAEERSRRLAGSAGGLAWALRALSVGRQPSFWDDLGSLAPPTLAVAGALDDKYCSIARALTARAPNARPVVVPGAGHAVHLERPAAFCAAVEEFLIPARRIP